MSPTPNAVRSTVLMTLCGAVLALMILTVSPTVADAREGRSGCANRLCTKVDDDAASCWQRDGRRPVARCFIARAARHYRQPLWKAYQVAHRESRYDWRATNASSGAAGLFQFMPRTWGATPYRDKSRYHPRWAALAAMWMWRKGYESHWVTY